MLSCRTAGQSKPDRAYGQMLMFAGVLYLAERSEDAQVQRSIEVSTRRQQLQWRTVSSESHFSILPGYLANVDQLNAVPADLQSDAMSPLELRWKEHRAGKASCKTYQKLSLQISPPLILISVIKSCSLTISINIIVKIVKEVVTSLLFMFS